MKIIPPQNRAIFEDGFSLVEILVAITITTILIGFAFGIYLFGQSLFLGWKSKLNLENEIHTLSHGITEQLFQADRIKTLEPQKLVIQKGNREKHYEVRNDTLFVNGRTLLNPSISLVALSLSARDKEGKVVKGSENLGDITFVKFALALADDKDTLRTTRSIHLRKPSNWNSLKKN